MCKYANNSIVEVATIEQLNTIKKVLENKKEVQKRPVPSAEFDIKLWMKDETKNSIIKK